MEVDERRTSSSRTTKTKTDVRTSSSRSTGCRSTEAKNLELKESSSGQIIKDKVSHLRKDPRHRIFLHV